MNVLKRLVLTVSLAISISVIAPAVVLADDPARGGVLRYAVPVAHPGLDPARVGTTDGYMLTALLFSNLVAMTPALTVAPQLASSWEASEDGLAWTFHLAPDVKFHDGRTLVAGDVVFSIKRIMDPATASRGAASFSMVKDVVAVDDLTVRFDLKTPYADLPMVLAAPFGRVIDPANIDSISTAPNGTGPFVLKEYVPGSKAVLDRNPNYFEAGLPYLDQVQQLVMSEPAAQMTALMKNEIQILDNAPKDLLGLIQRDKNVVVMTTPSPAFQPFVMFPEHRPFDDVRVRQALKLAIDREEMMLAATSGYGVVGNDTPVSPLSPWINTGIAQRQRDVATARKLLAEAGFPDGMDLTLITSGGRPGLEQAAVVAQQNMAEAGIRVKIQSIEMAAQSAMLRAGGRPYTMANINWAGRATIDESLTPFFGTGNVWNFSRYSNPDVDALLAKGRATDTDEARKAAYDAVQEILWNEGPEIVPYFSQYVSALRAEVQGYEQSPVQYVDLRKVWLKH